MKSKIVTIVFLAGSIFSTVTAQQSVTMTSELDSVSYGLGIVLGSSIGQAGINDLNENLFMQGIRDAKSNGQQSLTAEQANMVLNSYLTKLHDQKATQNLIEGQKFMAENAKQKDVVSLPSGLQYKVVKDGEGACPADTNMVTVHYTGKFIDGKVFDSSVERGQPAQFPVNGVIPGWTEALKLMKPGANWILYIPAELGYGENSPRGIEPNSVLIFDVQLLSFE
jgi:FKBP-type peptidyl-prolyl cis-trans isomerase FklB